MKSLLFIVLCLAPSAFAQYLYVNQHGDDRVGTNFAFELRQQIQSSRGYALLNTDDDKQLHLTVDLVTLDSWIEGVALQPPKGSASYASYAITMEWPRDDCKNGTHGQLLIDHGVMFVGAQRTRDSARSLLARIDKLVDAMAKAGVEGKIDK